jgi:hypothetical protein
VKTVAKGKPIQKNETPLKCVLERSEPSVLERSEPRSKPEDRKKSLDAMDGNLVAVQATYAAAVDAFNAISVCYFSSMEFSFCTSVLTSCLDSLTLSTNI